MATTSKKNKEVTRQDIIDQYMLSVLESEKVPVSVYKFCKHLKIDESDFYRHFGSFESLQNGIWVTFFHKALEVVTKSKEYASFGKREKLLTFYYTLFELLTLNRSYVLFALHKPGPMGSNLAQLNDMSGEFKEYLKDLNELSDLDNGVRQISEKAVEEIGCAQFLVILRFWMKDSSPQFEKTDVMIEKTINTTFDLVDIKPVRSIIDLAKFLIKERAFN